MIFEVGPSGLIMEYEKRREDVTTPISYHNLPPFPSAYRIKHD